jgi:4-hydroxy-3-methylbut-2-enyl diphosphate reductase
MEVILAKPRGFCAGVVRAIAIVETALEIYGSPVYVLHEIVHNHHVVKDLQERGAVFVEKLSDVPPSAVLIFSAHGVSNAVVCEAQTRHLDIIDATCPLVSKVHLEVARFARAGREVVLIGHAGHPEVNGTLGQYNRGGGGAIYLVETIKDAENLEVRDAENMAVVTQTTLSVDDTARIIELLHQRFPNIIEPNKDDICYATQNRQNSVRQLAGEIDVLLVVGARNSSNSNRLREVGEQMGVPSYLVQDAGDVDPAWFRRSSRIGVTAGASAPEVLVRGVLELLYKLGADHASELKASAEVTMFRLPGILKKQLADAAGGHRLRRFL